jgi:hypothetical protein
LCVFLSCCPIKMTCMYVYYESLAKWARLFGSICKVPARLNQLLQIRCYTYWIAIIVKYTGYCFVRHKMQVRFLKCPSEMETGRLKLAAHVTNWLVDVSRTDCRFKCWISSTS